MITQEEGRYSLRALGGEQLEGGYEVDEQTGALRDQASGHILGVYACDPVAPTPLPRADSASGVGHCIGVLDAEVMATIQQPWNDGAFFVVPARLNGTAYPDKKNAIEAIGSYLDLDTASARCQLAVHPAVGQFLLDNAANWRNREGIDAALDFLPCARRVGLKLNLVNGFLQLPQAGGEAPAAAFRSQLHTLRQIVMRGVPACGLSPDFQRLSRETHTVNLVYASGVPVQSRSQFEGQFQKEAATDFLTAQYYGAMRLACRGGRSRKHTKVYLMPIGLRTCSLTLEIVGSAMARAVWLLSPQERSALDIQALTWPGARGEKDALAGELSRLGVLLPPPGQSPRGFSPDGMMYSGQGEYGADGMHSPHAPGELPHFGSDDAPPTPHVPEPPRPEKPAPVEVEAGGAWFQAESNRDEQERRGEVNVRAIMLGVDELWRLGLCKSRRWTNDRDECDPPEMPEEVIDFPPEDGSLYIPEPANSGSVDYNRPAPGDQVEILQENGAGHFDPARVGTRGLLGTIVRGDGHVHGLPPFQVKLRNEALMWYELDWLAQDRGRPTKGDRVVVYTENLATRFDPERQGTRGKIGVVVKDYGPGPKSYDVSFANGQSMQFDDDWVAKVAEVPKVGDKVRVMIENPTGHFDENRVGTKGQIGVVLQDDGTDMPFLVQFKNGWSLYYGVSWVRKVPPTLLRVSLDPLEGESLLDVCGDYALDTNQEAEGLPVWKRSADRHAETWHILHCDTKGRWAVTKAPMNHILLVSRPHGGRFPQIVDQWGLLRRGTFIPVELYVQALNISYIPGKVVKREVGCCTAAKCGPGCGGCNEAFGGREISTKEPDKPVFEPASLMQHQLAHRKNIKTRRWERLVDYGPTSGPGCNGACSLFNDTAHKTHCGRVYQGVLDNAYLVEALNAISLRPKLARRLFFAWSVEFSVYAVRLFKNGTWSCVEVDDWVPVPMVQEGDDSDTPFCCHSEYFPHVLWPSIVEKAYAKASTIRDLGIGFGANSSGGWEAIGGGGRVEEALADLTGGVASTFLTSDVSADRLFVYLYELQRECLFVCRVHVANARKNHVLFNPLAHHAVNRAAHHEGQCFVQVFCSHNSGSIFDAGFGRLTVPEAMWSLYPEREEDGFFWLSIYDFHFYFDTIFECRLTNSPDVGIVGMPPSRFAHAAGPAAGMPWTPGKALPSFGEGMPGVPLLHDPWVSRPVFFEHIFAIASAVTEHTPPEFQVVAPQNCEVVATVEQTCNRISQVGSERTPMAALLLKVYEHVEGNSYSADLVCRSDWKPVRGAMVAFKTTHSGTFKIIAEMLAGVRVERLIFRCYTSAPNVTVSASGAFRQHVLVESDTPPAATKWTLVGSVSTENVDRANRPTKPEADLDELGELLKSSGSRCTLM